MFPIQQYMVINFTIPLVIGFSNMASSHADMRMQLMKLLVEGWYICSINAMLVGWFEVSVVCAVH